MSEDKKYKDADVVWVKLGNNWWPGEVTDVHRQPEGLLQHFKKRPYCVVKFFEEDSYEYVKTCKQIFPFQCQKKEEFIKKGLALFNAKNKFMEKFPSDVKIAENLSSLKTKSTNTQIQVTNHADSMVEAVLHQTKVHGSTHDKNEHNNSIQYLNIMPNQGISRLTPQTISQKTTTTPSNISSISAGSAYNSNIYKCNHCNFTSLRQNVMIFHRKTHTANTTPVSSKLPTSSNNEIDVHIEKPEQPVQHESPEPPATVKTAKINNHRRNSRSLLSSSSSSSSSKKVTTTENPTTIVVESKEATKIKSNNVAVNRTRRSRQLRTSEDDESSTKTADTADSNLSLVETKEPPVKQISSKPASKANSEELRQRLLADWSDEDNVALEEMQVESKTIDDCEINKINENKQTDVIDSVPTDDTKMAENHKITTDEVKSLKRIRNIPKKDRRELILKEFNNESNTKSTITQQDSGDSVELNDKANNPVPLEIKSNTNETRKIISCFDFHDEEEDGVDAGNEQNALKSISIFKKKLLENSHENNNSNEQETNQKFNQLTEEIESLLEQTSTTISNVDALQQMKSVKKEDLNIAAVKGLPIKERGKRIFKSRNRTHSNEENNEKTANESLKVPVKEINNENEIKDVAKSVETVENIKEKEEPEEEVVAEDGSSTISEADAEFGSSTSMLDDDRFPIIANKSEDITDKTQVDTTSIDSEPVDDDEEEIESPPHEELSGNELEEEIKRIRLKNHTNKSPTTTTTPTPKKHLKQKQQIQEHDMELTKDVVDQESHIKSAVEKVTVLPTKRKRCGHVKITPCRQFTDKNNVIAISKENAEITEVMEADKLIPSKRNKCEIQHVKDCEEVSGNMELDSNLSTEKKHGRKAKLATKRNHNNDEVETTTDTKHSTTTFNIKRNKSSIEQILNENLNSNRQKKQTEDIDELGVAEKLQMKRRQETKVNRTNCNDNNGISRINETLDSKVRSQSEEKNTNVLHATKILSPSSEKQNVLHKMQTQLIKHQQESIKEVKEFNEYTSDTEDNDQQLSKNDKKQQPTQPLTTLSVDEGQTLETQNEEQDENPKFLAVPTHPIPGYNETFLLCTVENNQYKPIDGVPLYLDQDLNQLQPVPLEALEGQSVLIVNQSPVELNTPPHTLKTILPATVAEEETQMLCLPTQVTDVMAEAAAATVSTIMTPALVRGNESNLQLSVPMSSALNKEEATSSEPVFLMDDVEGAGATAGCDLVADNAIIVNVNGQQIILEGQTLAQLLSNPEGSTQLVTDDGTEFVMTRELLAALEAQQDGQLPLLQRTSMSSPSPQDILAVALAGSDLYGNEMLELETSQTMQLVCNDGFQPGVHLGSPITAQTSETNALLNQTPIMSTLEVPTSTSLSEGCAAAVTAKLNSHDELAKQNLEDSLAVIGVTTQSSAIPTSLELPITVTNPAIAPKVSLSNVLPVSDALLQFAVQPSVSIMGDISNLCNDT